MEIDEKNTSYKSLRPTILTNFLTNGQYKYDLIIAGCRNQLQGMINFAM